MAGLLAGCGGGGGTALPVNAERLTACVPANDVRIQLFGDSTQELQGSELQGWMDGRYGAGRVLVSNLGRSGATSKDFPAEQVAAGAITVLNYGINDSREPGASVEAYKARLRAIKPSFFETPNPTFDGYAPAMREVAAELGRPVIDVAAAFRQQPGWRSQVPDLVHPSWSALLWITYQLVGPALAEEVDRRFCVRERDAAGAGGAGSAVRASSPSMILWGAQGGALPSVSLRYTNSGQQPVSLALSGLAPPYAVSPSRCELAARGGSCTVTISTTTSQGPTGGMGVQTLLATGGTNGAVPTLVWGMLQAADN